MSRLDMLSILGVRSFDNKRSETIQFYSPLTLIVGYNGSGKTTIIECLKYATTGDLPPNSKGGAFIHDPKLCGEREVLAQVKLSFYGTSGARMVASRSLQLTVKKNARTQKTLDCHLLMSKNGERTAISSRVAELDQLMPQYLGVSKAVLDNVIFCHQDESLWPMSEPSVLKKKFDEIFEALKYTKAIDNIKVLRKKQNEELAKLRIFEEHAKEDKDKGDRAEKKSKQLADEIEVLRQEGKELGERISEATSKAQEAFDRMSQFQLTVASLEGKRTEVRAKEDRLDDLRSRLKEMPEPDEELRNILEHYGERVAVHEEDEQAQRLQWTELNQQLEQSRNELGAKQSEHGRHQAAKDAYDRQIARLETLVRETARRHQIRGFDHELTEEQIREFIERVARVAREKSNAYDQARRETQHELQDAQNALSQLNERKSALHQRREGAKAQILSNDRKLDSLQRRLDQVNVDEGEKAGLESNIKDLDNRLKTAKLAHDSEDWEKQIDETKRQLQAIDLEAESLDSEFSQATKHVGDSAKVEFLRTSLKEGKQKLETMIGAHGRNLTKILGQEWHANDLESIYQRFMERKATDIKDAEHHRNEISRELEQIEFKLATLRNDLKTSHEELQKAEKIVRDECDDDPSEYPTLLDALEQSRETLKADRDNFSNMKSWYQECLKTAQENDVCRLCERAFRAAKERQQFLSKIEKRVNDAQLQVIEVELQSAEDDLKNMRAISSTYDTWIRLSAKEIPMLEAERNRLEPNRGDFLNKIEEQDRIVNDRRAAKREGDSLAKTVQAITKYHSEIFNYQTQIADMESKPTQTGMPRGLEELQDRLKEINEQRRSLNASYNKLTVNRSHSKSQAADLDLELRDAQARLSTIVNLLKEKTNLVGQMDELHESNKEQRAVIKIVDVDIEDLVPQISLTQAKYDDISSRGDGRERELQQEKDRVSESLNELRSADREIHSYIDGGGSQQLARTHREIQNLQDALSRIEAEQRQTTISINHAAEQRRNHEAIKQNIADNLAYRKLSRETQLVTSEIMQLEAENAEADRDYWNKEANVWQARRSKLTGEQASLVGQAKSKDDQLSQLLADWETDYRDAAFKYKEAHIKVEAYKAAVDDLGRYGGALDKAIMKYHTVKMEEINRIIEELWRRTYQGTDVDTIMIKSDNETQKGNKSYNYRVVMVKQDAEMDMRGRCSAGQKVLASIIIRLALAECFGQRCGLIALDEPTTNLDRDNIRALAESIHSIIRARQAQNNLQIIVITHDEEFLKHMHASDFGDYYFRVSRNETQKSEIERQAIADVI